MDAKTLNKHLFREEYFERDILKTQVYIHEYSKKANFVMILMTTNCSPESLAQSCKYPHTVPPLPCLISN